MRESWLNSTKDMAYINELYLMLQRDLPFEKIADWMAIHGLRHSNQMIKRTFKKAQREDLLEYFIKEEDIKIGDIIRSRFTARMGEVIGIHKDGDTIEVKWDSGGRQFLSKESVFKMRNKVVEDVSDLKKVHTVLNPYGDIQK